MKSKDVVDNTFESFLIHNFFCNQKKGDLFILCNSFHNPHNKSFFASNVCCCYQVKDTNETEHPVSIVIDNVPIAGNNYLLNLSALLTIENDIQIDEDGSENSDDYISEILVKAAVLIPSSKEADQKSTKDKCKVTFNCLLFE